MGKQADDGVDVHHPKVFRLFVQLLHGQRPSGAIRLPAWRYHAIIRTAYYEHCYSVLVCCVLRANEDAHIRRIHIIRESSFDELPLDRPPVH